MAVLKWRDPDTGEVFIVGVPKRAEVYVETTMLASAWQENKYSFEAEYPHAEYNIDIEVAPTATAEQFETFGAGMICGSATNNIATAIGDVPTVNIPIIIKVVKK